MPQRQEGKIRMKDWHEEEDTTMTIAVLFRMIPALGRNRPTGSKSSLFCFGTYDAISMKQEETREISILKFKHPAENFIIL